MITDQIHLSCISSNILCNYIAMVSDRNVYVCASGNGELAARCNAHLLTYTNTLIKRSSTTMVTHKNKEDRPIDSTVYLVISQR